MSRCHWGYNGVGVFETAKTAVTTKDAIRMLFTSRGFLTDGSKAGLVRGAGVSVMHVFPSV